MDKFKINLVVDAAQHNLMKRIRDEKGISIQFQIRKAIENYLNTMNPDSFYKLLKESEKRVLDMDKATGFDREPLTIALALEAGLKSDISAAFDALVMIRQVANYVEKKYPEVKE